MANLFYQIAGGLLFFVGFGWLYSAAAGILKGAGINLPLGKPLFKSNGFNRTGMTKASRDRSRRLLP